MQENYAGKKVEVSLMEINEGKGSFVASIVNAESDRVLKKLKIGSLVWGTVRLTKDYGAFVRMDGTVESALLHIANISWQRVQNVADHFAEGDRVRAVVIGMDEGFTRISLSTRDLEAHEGDMMRDPQKVCSV